MLSNTTDLTTENRSYVLPIILYWSLNDLVINLSSRFRTSPAVAVFLTFSTRLAKCVTYP